MVYNKLVRDKIPDMIRISGEKPIIRVLDEKEYMEQLQNKLDEEVAEFHRDHNVEELADILEVILALNESLGHTQEKLIEAYQHKHAQRGGFSDRVFLIGKE